MADDPKEKPAPAPTPEKDAEPANPNMPADPVHQEEGQQQG